ncbi:MAG TPA: hypothetical protein ENH01_00725 [Nitrospirae bacterium]|nr:hypothetical protein [Nitrospirota bacterium]
METNNISPIPIDTLIREIRTIYDSDYTRAETVIEAYLKQILKDCSPDKRIAVLQELIDSCTGVKHDSRREISFEQEDFSGLVSLLLGGRMSTAGLSSTELSEKLAHSLNTVFDALNRIIGVIHSTLLGEEEELQTIRHIIGSDLKEEKATESLHDYLDQIQQAFLVSHRAFQQAAGNIVNQIMNELDPDRISTDTEGGFKFGPFRKAELFEVYKERFQVCRSWYDSERFTADLLREFEKICQKLYKN